MDDPAAATAARRARRHALVFAAILLLSVGCDQATKQIATRSLSGPAISLAGDAVRFELAHNPGAFLSMGAALPESVRQAVFVVVVPCALAALLFLALRADGRNARSLLGAALIAGGGIGNWIDRLLNQGVVTDFVSLGVGSLRTGIFNVADVCVMAGVALLVSSAWRAAPRPPAGRDAPAPGAGPP